MKKCVYNLQHLVLSLSCKCIYLVWWKPWDIEYLGIFCSNQFPSQKYYPATLLYKDKCERFMKYTLSVTHRCPSGSCHLVIQVISFGFFSFLALKIIFILKNLTWALQETVTQEAKNKVIHSHKQLTWMCPKSHVYIYNMPFCVTEIAHRVLCFSTHHVYLPIQNPKAARIFLITRSTL